MSLRCPETQVALHEQGACCVLRTAVLKHQSPVHSSPLGPAKLQNNQLVQLVAIFNYNT